eukprot:19418-Eustigmatos_ZCMA.PRE.1
MDSKHRMSHEPIHKLPDAVHRKAKSAVDAISLSGRFTAACSSSTLPYTRTQWHRSVDGVSSRSTHL